MCNFQYFFILLQPGAASADTSGYNLRPLLLKNGKGGSDMATPSGSELFRSVRSDLSDLQQTVSITQNQASTGSSLTRRKPVELVFVLCLLF